MGITFDWSVLLAIGIIASGAIVAATLVQRSRYAARQRRILKRVAESFRDRRR